MSRPISFATLEGHQGACAAEFFLRELRSTIQPEREALTQLRDEWSGKLQADHDHFQRQIAHQSELSKHFKSELEQLKTDRDGQLKAEIEAWEKLHKQYDESLALQKPVRYWMMKATSHRIWAWVFGVVALACIGLAFWQLYAHAPQLLIPQPGAEKTWHPSYFSLSILIASAVFAVWIIRIFVRLCLSHTHLLSDANERVTMARTYISLLRSKGGLQDKDRELILQALFRPSATGIVKDDGVPLSWLDFVTRQKNM